MVYATPETTGHIPAIRTSISDPTGAGDSFMAGFLSTLATGGDVKTAVLTGSAAAAIVVSRVACAPAMPTPDELASFMATHPAPV